MPTPLPFKVGIELETLAGPYSTAPAGWVRVGEHCGSEFKFDGPASTEEDLNARVEAIGRFFEVNGYRVSNDCGFHVHIDTSTWSPDAFKRVVAFMLRYEKAIFMLPKGYRRNNHWAKTCGIRELNVYRRAQYNTEAVTLSRKTWRVPQGDKYRWMNLGSASHRGTVEFRLMHATTKASDVLGWVNFLLHVIDHVVNGGKKVSWGLAKARDPRMLFYTMLQQGGFYGRDIRNPARAKLAKDWAIGRYKKFLGEVVNAGPTFAARAELWPAMAHDNRFQPGYDTGAVRGLAPSVRRARRVDALERSLAAGRSLAELLAAPAAVSVSDGVMAN